MLPALALTLLLHPPGTAAHAPDWVRAAPAAVGVLLGAGLMSTGAVVAGGALLGGLAAGEGRIVGQVPTPGLSGTPRFLALQAPPFLLGAGAVLLGVAGLACAAVGLAWMGGLLATRT